MQTEIEELKNNLEELDNKVKKNISITDCLLGGDTKQICRQNNLPR